MVILGSGSNPQRGFERRWRFELGYKIWLHSHMLLGAFWCPSMRIKPLKSLGGRRTFYGFHAVDGGSNPPGDAKKDSGVSWVTSRVTLSRTLRVTALGVQLCG